MMRVAAHKLGSVSSFPQSDTVLTILTRPAEVHGAAAAAAARPARPSGPLSNRRSIYMARIPKMGGFRLNLSARGEK